MKVLSINLFYNEGSTGKIVADIHNYLLEKGHDSYVCYAIGKHKLDKRLFNFSSRFSSKFYTYLSALTGKQYTYSYLETYRLIQYIKFIKPDVVNIHAININVVNKYFLLEFLKKNKIRTVITFHSEIFYTGGCSHSFSCEKWKSGCGSCPNLWEATHSLFFDNTKLFWKKYQQIYNGFEDYLEIVCVSNWLKKRAETSPFFKNIKISTIENGTDTINTYHSKDFSSLKENYLFDNRKVILHVTPSFKSEIKGGKYVKELISRLDRNEFRFIIIGYDEDDRLPENVSTFKNINSPELLTKYYSMADITLITSRIETFSMVCAESLSCGTPVIGFKCGAPEEIAIEEFSSFVEYSNVDLLETEVYKWINKKNDIKFKCEQIAKIKYSKEKMAENYLKLYLNNGCISN